MKTYVRKSSFLVIFLLFLAVLLSPCALEPCHAASLPEKLPDDPWSKWVPPQPSNNDPVMSIPGSLVLQETSSSPATGTRAEITEAYFTNSEKMAKNQFMAQEGWYLVIKVNMPGRLYLYEYSPPGSIPNGRWLGYNTPIGEGTWQVGPFYAREMEPEGEHLWKLWLYSESAWATATPAFSYLRKVYTDPPEIKLTAEPAEIKSGDFGKLEWNVTGAATVDIQPSIGRVGPSGQKRINPNTTTTYTLTATNNVGTSTRTVDLIVSASEGMPVWMIWTIIAIIAVAGGSISFILSRRHNGNAMAAERETAIQDNPTITASAPTVTRSQTAIKTTVKTKILDNETAMAEGRLELPGGNEILLSTASKWIGRADFAGIIPDQEDNFISRQHVLITYEGGEYYIEDQNSGNGTRLNGADIKGNGKQKLNTGDKIELAEAVTVAFRKS